MLVPADIIVRYGNQADLPSLEWEGEYAHFRRLFAEVYQQALLGRSIIWIAELTNIGLIGQLFVSLNSSRNELADGKTRAYLFGFRVRPAYRDHGIGKYLIQAVENDLIQRGFEMLTLNVGQDNQAGIRFYENMGFQVISEDPGKWSYVNNLGQRINVHEPAWRMIKDLNRSKDLVVELENIQKG